MEPGAIRSTESQNENVRIKKRGCFSNGVKITFYGILLFFLLFALILGALYFRYYGWKNSLEDSFVEENFSSFDADKYSSVREDIEKKVDRYVESREEVETLELTQKEVSILLYDSFSQSLPKDLKLEKIYISPGDNEWEIYLEASWRDINLPWVWVTVANESFESAELFIKDIYVGPYSISGFGMDGLIDMTNDGYRNALLFVNQNNVSDREYENIELTDEGIVIKGKRIE